MEQIRGPLPSSIPPRPMVWCEQFRSFLPFFQANGCVAKWRKWTEPAGMPLQVVVRERFGTHGSQRSTCATWRKWAIVDSSHSMNARNAHVISGIEGAWQPCIDSCVAKPELENEA